VNEALRSSAIGASIEAPKGVGCGEGVFPSLLGEGSREEAVPPPQKNSCFLLSNGEIWCILGRIFTVAAYTNTHAHTQTAFIHQVASAMQSRSLILEDKPNE